MSIGLLYWIIMIFALLFGGWSNYGNYIYLGHGLVIWFLLFLIGWQIFGAPIKKEGGA